jgi:hypothetical protein
VAENFKAADVIAVFVRKNDTVELLRSYAALLQAQYHLPRAQTSVNQDPAMIGCH